MQYHPAPTDSPPPDLLTVGEKLGDYSHLGSGHTVRPVIRGAQHA